MPITSTQEGTGNPSPSNVRNIVGVDNITLTVNGNDIVIDLDGAKYGGIVDAVNDRLIINKSMVEYDGSADENWYINGSYGVYMIVPTNYRVRDVLVSKYLFASNKTSGSQLSDNECCMNTNKDLFLIKDTSALSVESFKSALSNTPMQVVFSLIKPIEISLPDISDISTIIGNNSISSDTSAVTVSYKALPIDLL